MSKTTQTTFQKVNGPDMQIRYYDDYIAVRQVNEAGELELDELYLDYDDIKRINRIINKNAREKSE